MKNKFTYLFSLIFFATLVGIGSNITANASSWHDGIPPYFDLTYRWETKYMPANGEKGIRGKTAKYKMHYLDTDPTYSYNSPSLLVDTLFVNSNNNKKLLNVNYFRKLYAGQNIDPKLLRPSFSPYVVDRLAPLNDSTSALYPHYKSLGNNYYKIISGSYSDDHNGKEYRSINLQYNGKAPAGHSFGHPDFNQVLIKILNRNAIKIWVYTDGHAYGKKHYYGIFYGHRFKKGTKFVDKPGKTIVPKES